MRKLSRTESSFLYIRIPYEVKQRLAALFLFAVFAISLLTPPLSVYAATQTDNTSSAGHYPGPIPIEKSDTAAAADAKPTGLLAQLGGSNGLPQQVNQPKFQYKTGELLDKRTATSDAFGNGDGTVTEKHYFTPKYFQKDGNWSPIDTTLVEDKNAGDATNIVTQTFGVVESWFTDETTFIVKDNDWQARFAPSDFDAGMLRIKQGDSQVGYKPVGANQVNPQITTDKDGKQTVHYYNLWQGIDVEYAVDSQSVKENIILKDKNSATSFSFELVGATAETQDASTGLAFKLKGALGDKFGVVPANLMLNKFGYAGRQTLQQTYQDGKLTVSVDKAYLQSLPNEAFPAVIDPTTTNVYIAGSSYYKSIKSDGTICTTSCDLYAGSLQDAGLNWRQWRAFFYVPYTTVQGKVLNSATLYLTKATYSGSGDTSAQNFYAERSVCNTAFNCEDTSIVTGGTIGSSGSIDVTPIYQSRMNANDYNMWLIVKGYETQSYNYKAFVESSAYISFVYSIKPSAPTVTAPTGGQVVTDPQVSFKVSQVSNPNSGTVPLQYELLVSNGPGGVGSVVWSGLFGGSQWTIPDGMLQDGTTYYVQAHSFDSTGGGFSDWSPSVQFKVDMRVGKDKTQAYDSLGPVDVNLATGSVSTSISSHTSAALGGSLGVNLEYNSSLRSRNGLVGTYWDNTTMTDPNKLQRVDQAIDFSWDQGSPSSGNLPADNFSAKWEGYFVAPAAGTYYFGGINDDQMNITVNGQSLYSNSYCWPGPCYGSTISLTAGQVVPITITYVELTGGATAKLYVKGAVSEQIVPSRWLQTGVRALNQRYGLTGSYYGDVDGTHTLNSNNPMFMQRVDSPVDFNWGSGSPVSGGPTDNFFVRWYGYVTVPVGGTYYFGAASDDGVRVNVNGTTVLDRWFDQASENYGSGVNLNAGQTVPITIDYFEHGGGASFTLKVKVPNSNTGVTVPYTWMSPRAQVLPDGWNLSIDPDGNLGYDRAKIGQNSVLLTDPGGGTHEYLWSGSGYAPPANEDGQLARNSDGTFTLHDTDGRTYIFAADGTLTSVTSAVDDRNPAALQYSYQSVNGGPATIREIKDGVDNTRKATVYYSGESQCGSAPTGYDANAPANMLCAVITNDGRATYFYYQSGNLARVVRPGNDVTDYGYSDVQTSGGQHIGYQLIYVRDSLANDAIAASVRADDATTKTEISYDIVGRVSDVKQPAATAGATRIEHTVEYIPGNSAIWTTPEVIADTAPTGSPDLVNWGNGRLALFARHTSDLKYKYYVNGQWTDGWQTLQGCMQDDPGSASWEPDRIDVFIRGCDNILYTKTLYNGVWSANYSSLGSTTMTSSPSATSWGQYRYDVVAKGPSGDIMQRAWTPSTGWTGFSSLGGGLCTAPSVSTWGYDRLNVFAGGCDGASSKFWAKYYQSGWGGYVDETPNDRITSAPASVSTPDKQIHVVAKGVNNELRYMHYNGAAWEGWQTAQSCMSGTPAITQSGDTTFVVYKGCDGQLYQTKRIPVAGTAKTHVVGATEPSGYSQQVDYDNTYRTVKSYDNTGLVTQTDWDALKDLSYSTTDPLGLKATTIYDYSDRPVDQYGPAPAAWFDVNHKPLSAYTSQVPHTQTSYDGGITGPAVMYMTASLPTESDTLTNGAAMTPGQIRLSKDRRFRFIYQLDGNLVLYGPNGSMWASGTTGIPSDSLVMQNDGNLVLYNAGVAKWATNTGGAGSSTYLIVQSDGNMVLYHTGGTVWATNTGGWAAISYGFASLSGAPLVHATNIGGDPATVNRNFGTGSPATGVPSTNWGMRLTGKMVLPTSGGWGIRVNSDNGVRMWIDDKLVIDDWYDGAIRNHPTYTYNNALAGSAHRVRVDYYHLSSTASFGIYLTPPGQGETGNVAQYFLPDYGLPTSTTTYDATIGNTTATTSYGSNPELGLAQSATVDPTGLNLTSSSTYETQGASGSFLRQTSKTLPGGGTTNYAYYGATETRDDPCTTGTTEAYKQAGFIKTKTEADPDGAGAQTGRVSETIYDDAGRTVASRYNTDSWICTTYDTRGRVTQVVVPTINGRTGRTVTTNYSYQGSPLKVQVVDSVAGTTVSEVDLLGRAVSGTDTFGNTSTASYDNLGRLTTKVSPLGTETYAYDNYSRPTTYSVNSTTYTTVTYDTYSRVQDITYNQAKDASNNMLKLEQIKRDNLLRSAGAVYRFTNGTAYDETATRTQSGMVSSYTDAYNGSSAGGTYTYDKAGRLTAATIDTNTYSYGYGTPTGCTGTYNANSNKNSNRTSFTVNGTTTTYCYDYADRLLSSSDVQLGTPTYDDHGNTATLSGNGTSVAFTYDATDTNTAIQQGTYRVEYVKTAGGNVLRKKEYQSGTLTKSYRYLAGGAVMQNCSLTDDTSCTTTDTYLTLPGNVTLTLAPTNPDTTKRIVYSLKNFHGDTAITASSTGLPASSIYLYEPFGQTSSSTTFGTNSNPTNATDNPMGWAANPTRKLAGSFSLPLIQMGARVYLPTAGRFLQVDPIEGGTLNSYVYAGDPVNGSDYSGKYVAYIWAPSIIGGVVAADKTAHFKDGGAQFVSMFGSVLRQTSRSNAVAARLYAAPKQVSPTSQKTATINGQPFLKAVGAEKSKYDAKFRQGSGERFNYYNAFDNAFDYSAAGRLGGAAIGCGIGVWVGGVGCLVLGPIGAAAGGVGGAVYGFLAGGYGWPGADALGGMPDVDVRFR